MKEVISMIDLSKYGITGTTEIVYNPSYEVLLFFMLIYCHRTIVEAIVALNPVHDVVIRPI